ncbi:MAG: hypothetical protein P1V18_04795 [Candidatus Gracilibacteria bacterium]|nr:hypothetical protein [Candidatus Gracilibacteria bacterium]
MESAGDYYEELSSEEIRRNERIADPEKHKENILIVLEKYLQSEYLDHYDFVLPDEKIVAYFLQRKKWYKEAGKYIGCAEVQYTVGDAHPGGENDDQLYAELVEKGYTVEPGFDYTKPDVILYYVYERA